MSTRLLKLDMDDNFQQLKSNVVVTIGSYSQIVLSHCTFRVGEFTEAMTEILRNNISATLGVKQRENLIKWFSEGITGEILSPSKEWKKEKVRIKVTIEFCPDQPDVEEEPVSNHVEISLPESPLDDIRKMINEQS